MAVHSYSFLDLKTAVLAAAGTTTLASTLDTGDIVNDALVYLSGLREWRWLRSALTLNVTADQNYVPLPADFGQMQALSGASGSYAAVRWIDVEELIWLRQYASQTADGVQAVAVSWTSQTSASVLPLGRLEIYPTPSANETGALTGLYTKLVRKLEQDTDVPNVPGYCHPPLKTLCRALAVGETEERGGPMWQMFQQQLQPAIRMDSQGQPSHGMIVGTSAFANNTAYDDKRFDRYSSVSG